MSASHPAHEGAPNGRFHLDAAGFERLLIAAWVIQTQRDLELSPAEYEGLENAFSSYSKLPANDLPSLETLRAKAIIAKLPKAQNSTVLRSVVKLPPGRVEVNRSSEVVGSLALLPNVVRSRQLNTDPFQVIGAPGAPASGKINGHEPANKVLPFVRTGVRVRLVQSKVYFSVAKFAIAGAVLVLIITGLLLELRSHADPTSVKASGPSAAFIPRSVLGANPSAMDSPKIDLSHLRVTDDAVFLQLAELSPYELRLTRRQAEFGDENAALVLGMAYETGQGLPQNCVQAAHWIVVAAQDGDPAAEYNLALRYLQGDGVPVDQLQARTWLQKAASGGYEQARRVLDQLGS